MSDRIEIEEVSAVEQPPRARVEAAEETPGQTLVIKLTPRARVPLMQLMQLIQIDPQNALAQFRIEASTGL